MAVTAAVLSSLAADANFDYQFQYFNSFIKIFLSFFHIIDDKINLLTFE